MVEPMTRLQVISVIAICCVVAGCSNHQDAQTINTLRTQLSAAQSANSKLQAQVDELSEDVKRLSDTPSVRLQAIQELVAKGDLDGAKVALSQLKEIFPDAQETQTAESLVAELSAQIQAKQQQLAKLKSLKFRALPVTPSITSNGVTFHTLKVFTTKRWVSDSYQYEYHYNDADRGTKYIVLRANISSAQSKNPNLFPVAVYKVSGSNLDKVAEFSYAFVRWHDYGSYLGNYGDSGNDFAKSKTVKFTLAAQVSDSDLSAPLVVVASDEQCVNRIERDLPPAVAYLGVMCESLKQELSLDDMAGKSYHVIGRMNL